MVHHPCVCLLEGAELEDTFGNGAQRRSLLDLRHRPLEAEPEFQRILDAPSPHGLADVFLDVGDGLHWEDATGTLTDRQREPLAGASSPHSMSFQRL